MADLHLYIGYREVSSWSLRAWLPLRKTGAAFDETLIRYRVPEQKARLAGISPTGKVPYLIDRRGGGDIRVWDSLAIGEYLAESFPEAKLWPADREARAFARSVAAEMHSGFRALREHLPMALLKVTPKEVTDRDALSDIARMTAIWREARERWGAKDGGPWLFGHFTVADAQFAPIATRFRTYATPLDPVSAAYRDAVLADPDFRAWEAQAKLDPPQEPLPG